MKSFRVRRKVNIINDRNSNKVVLSVFRSNRNIVAQLIDSKGQTIASYSSVKLKNGKPIEKATETGKEIAKIAKSKKINTIIFDRNRYSYHGQVKALADGAREAGLKF